MQLVVQLQRKSSILFDWTYGGLISNWVRNRIIILDSIFVVVILQPTRLPFIGFKSRPKTQPTLDIRED